jgi:hypothetical protein
VALDLPLVRVEELGKGQQSLKSRLPGPGESESVRWLGNHRLNHSDGAVGALDGDLDLA